MRSTARFVLSHARVLSIAGLIACSADDPTKFMSPQTKAAIPVAIQTEPSKALEPPSRSDIVKGGYIVVLRDTVQSVEKRAKTIQQAHGGRIGSSFQARRFGTWG